MSGLTRSAKRVGLVIRAARAHCRTEIALSSPATLRRSAAHSMEHRMLFTTHATHTVTRTRPSPSPSTRTADSERPIETDPEVVYEYSAQSNPAILGVPIRVLPAVHHQTGSSRVTPFDLSHTLSTPYPATSPNLLTSFIRIVRGEQLTTTARATSQAFYVIRGQGSTVIRDRGADRTIDWRQGDLFVVPYSAEQSLEHRCDDVEVEHGGAALYWIHDEPLLRYLGVVPSEAGFTTTKFSAQFLLDKVEKLRHDPAAASRNRLGILIANADTKKETKTLTHVLWSLLNVLPARTTQPPHRHNSVAIDLCISAAPDSDVHTAMSQYLATDGKLVDPQRVQWASGAAFVTPPGYWHEHVNNGAEDAWVLPLQDAGLVTHQRILDIRFAPDEVRLSKKGLLSGISLNPHVAVVGQGAN